MTKLRLSKELYDYENIKEAVCDFDELALIEISESEAYYLIYITKCKFSEERTSREFENYLIDLTNKNRR